MRRGVRRRVCAGGPVAVAARVGGVSGRQAGGGSWAAEHAVELAVAWPLVIVAVFLPLSVRRYRRLERGDRAARGR
jgi:hypothetical protein